MVRLIPDGGILNLHSHGQALQEGGNFTGPNFLEDTSYEPR